MSKWLAIITLKVVALSIETAGTLLLLIRFQIPLQISDSSVHDLNLDIDLN